MLPTKEENPNGLYQKYELKHTDGSPIDPCNEYFILKVCGVGNIDHMIASRIAIRAYADAIKDAMPELAADLMQRYPR